MFVGMSLGVLALRDAASRSSVDVFLVYLE